MEWMVERLRELRDEFADGEGQLVQIDRHRTQVRDSLLRIEGAIRVLEEQIEASGAFAASSPGPQPGRADPVAG